MGRRNGPPKVGIKIDRRDEETGEVYARLRWTNRDGTPGSELLKWVTEEQAERLADAKEAMLLLGITGPVSKQQPVGYTVADALVDYGTELERNRTGGDGYRTNVLNRSAPLSRHLGKILVSELTEKELGRYVATRRTERGGRELTGTREPTEETGRFPKRITVGDELRLLRRVVDKTRAWGKHTAQFCGMPSMSGWPEDKRPARKLSDAEITGLIDTAAQDRPEVARLLRFLSWCPRRPIAVFALERQHVTRVLDRSYKGRDLAFFERDKGGNATGWGPLLPEAQAVLVEHLAGTIGPPDELIWRTATGLPYTANRLAAVLRYLNVKAGVPDVSPYDLRKLAAVRAYRRVHRDLKATCQFTGHLDHNTLVKHYLFDEDDLVIAATGRD